MKKCLCGGDLEENEIKREGVRLAGMMCKECDEIYISGEELLRYEVLTGKRKSFARKVSKIGASRTIRIPKNILKQFNIKEGDYVLFKAEKGRLELEIIKSKA